MHVEPSACRPGREAPRADDVRQCLAVHMAGADRRDHRLPSTVLGRLGHLVVGAVLGAVVAAIVIEWMTR